MAVYSIGEMERQTGVSISTLHYYERIGLLDPVHRAANGHREYRDKDLLRVEFLKRLRATGMPIREMLDYVALYRAGDSTLTERRETLEAHREAVVAQMAELQATLDLLDTKITRYRAQETELERM
jgi:DNA-binding transcriptional MerR regulator